MDKATENEHRLNKGKISRTASEARREPQQLWKLKKWKRFNVLITDYLSKHHEKITATIKNYQNNRSDMGKKLLERQRVLISQNKRQRNEKTQRKKSLKKVKQDVRE